MLANVKKGTGIWAGIVGVKDQFFGVGVAEIHLSPPTPEISGLRDKKVLGRGKGLTFSDRPLRTRG